jgi:MoxR-like ATPase
VAIGMSVSKFRVFTGSGKVGEAPPKLPSAPPWREFDPSGTPREIPPYKPRKEWAPITHAHVVDMVNAAIALRRPLLVTGGPGSGKSTLAEIIAAELSLGRVLRWPITSSSRLQSALYDYDAIGRVHDENWRRSTTKPDEYAPPDPMDIGRYIRLGPVGTALLPWKYPRVLLVDEIDKSDIDLPNDLLHVLERGEFEIKELARLPELKDRGIRVLTDDRGEPVEVSGGQVRCNEFPIVLFTSNQERAFPPAFLRRCLRLDMKTPVGEQLFGILKNQVGSVENGDFKKLVSDFEETVSKGSTRATDQILNAVYLVTSTDLDGESRKRVSDALLGELDGSTSS